MTCSVGGTKFSNGVNRVIAFGLRRSNSSTGAHTVTIRGMDFIAPSNRRFTLTKYCSRFGNDCSTGVCAMNGTVYIMDGRSHQLPICSVGKALIGVLSIAAKIGHFSKFTPSACVISNVGMLVGWVKFRYRNIKRGIQLLSTLVRGC